MLITPTSYRKKHLDEVKSERKQREREKRERKLLFQFLRGPINDFSLFPSSNHVHRPPASLGWEQ